jgi:hypothetical protein
MLSDSLLVPSEPSSNNFQRKLVLEEWRKIIIIDTGFMKKLHSKYSECTYSKLLLKLLIETFGKSAFPELTDVNMGIINLPKTDPLCLVDALSDFYLPGQVDSHPLLEHIRVCSKITSSECTEDAIVKKPLFRKKQTTTVPTVFKPKTRGMDGR